MMRSALLSSITAVALAPAASAQFFQPGNVVVLRTGDPALTLGSTAAPVFLEEWDTTTNTLVQTVEVPNSNSVPTPPISFTHRGFSSSEGQLNLSPDGRYLTLAGYNRTVGDTDPSAELALTTQRVIAVVDVLTGLIDTSTALTDAYDGVAFRGVATDDGLRFWTAGALGAVHFVGNLGATTSMGIAAGAPSNLRFIGIHGFDLFVTSASTGAGTLGVLQVGTGLPTTGGQSQTLLPGFPTAGGIAAGNPYDFWFADDDTLYVADANQNSVLGCVQKWTFNGTTWTRQYVLQAQQGGAVFGARGITGIRRNGVNEIWFTGEEPGFFTYLCKVVDNGPSSPVTIISQEPPETDYRGLRVIGSQIVRVPVGCSQSSLQVQGSGLVGTNVATEMVNTQGFALINYSLQTLGLPLASCSCTIAYDLGVLVGGPTVTLPIPNNPTLVGTTVYQQGFDLFDPTTSCVGPVPGLVLSATDGFEFTIR